MRRIKHKIRSAYGFTDKEIIDHIAEYGQDWAIEAYEMIMEDENYSWQILLTAIPLGRTPMDKKFGKELGRYSKRLSKNIEQALVPWLEARRVEAIRKRLAKPPESKTYDEHGNEVDLNDPDWWKKEV